MKPFSLWLTEARKNPEMNPKVSAYEAVKQYKNDPDVYISFTDELQTTLDMKGKPSKAHGDSKIGINPKSNFFTPLGIYCYPLAQAFEIYDIDKSKSLRVLPFAADRPFVYILRGKTGEGFINDMYKNYTSKNYDKDYKILSNIFLEYCRDYENSHAIMLVGKVKSVAKLEVHDIYDLEDIDAFFHSFNGSNIAKGENEFFTRSQDKYGNTYNKLNKDKADELYRNLWVMLVKAALASRKEANPIMGFWQLSKLLSMVMDSKGGGNAQTVKWNSILRKCGYTGFADKSGKGYIHESEPMQAVFLSRDAFTVIDRVQNKDHGVKSYIQNMKDLNKFLEGNLKNTYSILTFLLSGGLDMSIIDKVSVNNNNEEILENASFEDIIELLRNIKDSLKFSSFGTKIYDYADRVVRLYDAKNHLSKQQMMKCENILAKISHEILNK